MRNKSELRIVALVEARMSSSRLPGKVMKEVLNKPLLALLIERLKHSKMIDQIIVATSTLPEDSIIVDCAKSAGVGYFQGSLEDVLGRILEASRKANADVLVEITGDCPLLDPLIVDRMVQEFLDSDADYVSNVLEQTYPAGLDVQVFTRKALEDINIVAKLPEEREHGSWLIYRDPETTSFKLKNIKSPKELFDPNLRLMVDYQMDFELIKRIFEKLYPVNPEFSTKDILDLLNREPALRKINNNIEATIYQGQKIAESAE